MILEHEINAELSLKVYERCKRFIEPKGCYPNTFHVATHFMSKFRTKEWRVAYGYISAYENLYTRHAFIVDSNGLAIDPTLAQFDWFGERLEYKHLSFKIYDDIDDYFDAINDNEYYPDLIKELRDYEMKAQEWVNQRNLVIIG